MKPFLVFILSLATISCGSTQRLSKKNQKLVKTVYFAPGVKLAQEPFYFRQPSIAEQNMALAGAVAGAALESKTKSKARKAKPSFLKSLGKKPRLTNKQLLGKTISKGARKNLKNLGKKKAMHLEETENISLEAKASEALKTKLQEMQYFTITNDKAKADAIITCSVKSYGFVETEEGKIAPQIELTAVMVSSSSPQKTLWSDTQKSKHFFMDTDKIASKEIEKNPEIAYEKWEKASEYAALVLVRNMMDFQ